MVAKAPRGPSIPETAMIAQVLHRQLELRRSQNGHTASTRPTKERTFEVNNS